MNEKQKELAEAVIEEIIKPVLPDGDAGRTRKFLVNPTGRFEIGGPHGDAGVTGRKIIVDTYGGAAPHGGGAFSGKDPSKVDRSAAYAARYVAKNVVAAGLARQCQVQLSYAIGVARPINVTVYTEGTGKIPTRRSPQLVNEHFDLRPKGIIRMLDLLRPIYRKTAAYGHFGRDEPEFTWEATDRAEALRAAAGLRARESGADGSRRMTAGAAGGSRPSQPRASSRRAAARAACTGRCSRPTCRRRASSARRRTAGRVDIVRTQWLLVRLPVERDGVNRWTYDLGKDRILYPRATRRVAGARREPAAGQRRVRVPRRRHGHESVRMSTQCRRCRSRRPRRSWRSTSSRLTPAADSAAQRWTRRPARKDERTATRSDRSGAASSRASRPSVARPGGEGRARAVAGATARACPISCSPPRGRRRQADDACPKRSVIGSPAADNAIAELARACPPTLDCTSSIRCRRRTLAAQILSRPTAISGVLHRNGLTAFSRQSEHASPARVDRYSDHDPRFAAFRDD